MQTKDLVTCEDVRKAWKIFNDLQTPGIISQPGVFKSREIAWINYTKVRDVYLHQHGVIRVPVYVIQSARTENH